MGRIVFFISEAFRALRRSTAPSAAAIVTVAVTTVLLGVLIPILQTSKEKTDDVRAGIGLNVFFEVDATRDEVQALQPEIQAMAHVTAVEFVGKQEALEILRGKLDNELAAGLNELGDNNPLPFAYRISVDSPANIEAVRQSLEPVGAGGQPEPFNEIISQVNDARDESERLTEVTGAVTIVLIVIAILLVVASVMLIANTIRLSIYARRREVEVMRLVGATNWFIRWPFMIEGLLVGLIGAGIAIGVLWLGKVLLLDPLTEGFSLVDDLDGVGFLPLTLLLLVAAVSVSMIGSGLTLRRFLRV